MENNSLFFRVFRVFRGLIFVGSQMENGNSASGLIDKIYPQRNADPHRFSDPGLGVKTNAVPGGTSEQFIVSERLP